MKKKVIVVLVLIFGIWVTGCSDKLTESEIKAKIRTINRGTAVNINEITFATTEATINEINVKVDNNTLILGDYITKSNEEIYKQITGYYDQSSETYYIYILSENKKGLNSVWIIKKGINEAFNGDNWEKRLFSMVTDLILTDCNEVLDTGEKMPAKKQVYAVSGSELVLLN